MEDELTLSTPVLDPRNEFQLARDAEIVVFNKSNGLLNDFSDGSIPGALIQGQAWAGAEFLYYANKNLPALVIEFLKNTGETRSLGKKARASVTFSLTAIREQPFTIPANFEVKATVRNKTYSFFTESIVQIPPRTASITVDVVAAEEGPEYNVPRFTIKEFTQPLNFLASVINPAPAEGGLTAESEEAFIARAIERLSLRNPVSAADFEKRAKAILGEGSVAKAIGLLAANRVTKEPGAVHLFLLNSNGQPANTAQQTQVYAEISERLMLGTALYVSPMELKEISGEVTAKLNPGEDPDVVADELWAAFQDYLSPAKFPVGATVIRSEAIYNLRLTGGVDYISQLRLNDELNDIPMSNQWTVPVAYSLLMNLVTDTGLTFELVRGEAEPTNFNPAP